MPTTSTNHKTEPRWTYEAGWRRALSKDLKSNLHFCSKIGGRRSGKRKVKGVYKASNWLPSDHRGKNPFGGLWLFRLYSLITKLWNLGRCSRFCLLTEQLFFGRTQSNHYFELPARSACVMWARLWQKKWKYQKVIKAMRCVFVCKISLEKIKIQLAVKVVVKSCHFQLIGYISEK